MEKCNVPVMTQEQKGWMYSKTSQFNCILIAFHGSHLYGLDRETSDIDVKAIYLPSKTDLILGNAVETKNFKNDELDIEIEIKSLSSFLKSAKSCDTNCVDLLHCPDEMVIYEDLLWKKIQSKREGLYAKNMKGIIGYIKTHTHKYSNKLDRLQEMNWLRDKIVDMYQGDDLIFAKIETLSNTLCNSIKSKKYLKQVTLVQDHEQQYLEVCGKKYIYTWSVSQLLAALDKEISRYGKRSNEGLQKGLDTKSLSHAIRVLYQLKEMIETKDIKFPLKDREYIKQVKLGEVPLEQVMNKIDNLFEENMIMLEASDFPEEVDLSEMYKVVEGYYFG
ncbi:putative nucleotidyltransferase [Vibrio phage 1.084.O._10N.261.49.F5]|nr:putative nucleotidyltransferase [Vibrio phage 1.084.O._10N.261.49.F5]